MEGIIPPRKQSIKEFFLSIGINPNAIHKAVTILNGQDIEDVDSLLSLSEADLTHVGLTLGVLLKLRPYLNGSISPEELHALYESLKDMDSRWDKEIVKREKILDESKELLNKKKKEREIVITKYDVEIAKLGMDIVSNKELLEGGMRIKSKMKSFLEMPAPMLCAHTLVLKNFLSNLSSSEKWSKSEVGIYAKWPLAADILPFQLEMSSKDMFINTSDALQTSDITEGVGTCLGYNQWVTANLERIMYVKGVLFRCASRAMSANHLCGRAMSANMWKGSFHDVKVRISRDNKKWEDLIVIPSLPDPSDDQLLRSVYIGKETQYIRFEQVVYKQLGLSNLIVMEK